MRGHEVNKGGRPRIEFSERDWTQLINLMRIQCTRVEICGVLQMDEKTLNRIIRERGEGSFSLLYEKHQDEGKASLRRAQWKAATENLNPAMLIWLGKNVLDQTDRQRVDNTSSDNTTAVRIVRYILPANGREPNP